MKVVAINGTFDLVHRAHLKMLKYAKSLGDMLIVGINSDLSVKKLKGDSRPINHENDRKDFLLELGFIDGVAIFDELNAVEFLKKVKPDIYCVGGRYNLQTMNQEEQKYLESIGAEIKFFPLIEGYSTSKIIEKLNK